MRSPPYSDGNGTGVPSPTTNKSLMVSLFMQSTITVTFTRSFPGIGDVRYAPAKQGWNCHSILFEHPESRPHNFSRNSRAVSRFLSLSVIFASRYDFPANTRASTTPIVINFFTSTRTATRDIGRVGRAVRRETRRNEGPCPRFRLSRRPHGARPRPLPEMESARLAG